MVSSPCGEHTSFGISTPFGMLSPSERQVAYALLTRLPLGSLIQQADQKNPVRLACVKHAASVRPEPGSNSPINLLKNLDGSHLLKELPIAMFLVNRCFSRSFLLSHLAYMSQMLHVFSALFSFQGTHCRPLFRFPSRVSQLIHNTPFFVFCQALFCHPKNIFACFFPPPHRNAYRAW